MFALKPVAEQMHRASDQSEARTMQSANQISLCLSYFGLCSEGESPPISKGASVLGALLLREKVP